MEQSTPSSDAIRAELDKLLASAAFRGANRSSALLRFVVTAALEGRSQYLKEYTLGTDVLGRGNAFDPRVDPIVRVEASRLRGRLDLYYSTEGAGDELVISLPKGTYVPQFAARTSSRAAPASGVADKHRAAAWRRRDALWLAGGTAMAAVLALAYSFAPALPSTPSSSASPLHVDVALGVDSVIASQVGNSIALSPQGDVVVAVVLGADGRTRLVSRRLDALRAVELEGTSGAVSPFFSPDGRWVGYWAEGRLSKTLAGGGGSPIVLAESPDFLGASWGADGYIVARLDRSNALWRVPEADGPTIAVPLDAERASLRWPQLLPGGRAVLGTSLRANGLAIEVVPLDGGPGRTLLPAGTWARYVSSGHLVYVDRGALFAVAFDLERLETRGTPVRVLDDVAHDAQFGFAQVAAADNGALVYLRSAASGLSTIRWLDGGTASRPLLAQPARYQWPRLSPDGSHLAYALLEGSDPDIWTLDLVTGAKTRLTAAGTQMSPIWSPDSRYLFYSDATKPGLYWQRADGTGGATLLSEGQVSAWSFTADGTRLVHHRWDDATSFDLAALSLEFTADGPRAERTDVLLATRAFENYPAVSPDGRWLAYCSNESGTWEVYVRGYPDGPQRQQVSANGGCIPAWAPDSGLLFYETIDQRMMALAYRVEGGVFVPGEAEPWSSVRLANTGVIANFDVSAGGVVALVAADSEQTPPDHVTLVTSFFDELRRSVPPR